MERFLRAFRNRWGSRERGEDFWKNLDTRKTKLTNPTQKYLPDKGPVRQAAAGGGGTSRQGRGWRFFFKLLKLDNICLRADFTRKHNK